jgi:hypothetical protein
MTFKGLKVSRLLGCCLLSVSVLGLTAGKIATLELSGAEPIRVSIIQLIATPQSYDGKSVIVAGFMRLEVEGDALYLHEEDFKYGLTINSVWLTVTDAILDQREKYTDKYVEIEGTFNARNTGHFGMFSGSIENIKRLDITPSRNDLDEKRKRD